MASRFCIPAHFVPQSTVHSGSQRVRWGRWPENAGYCFRLYGVSFQRLAAYLPGLACPYARSGSSHSGYLEHPLGEFLRTPYIAEIGLPHRPAPEGLTYEGP